MGKNQSKIDKKYLFPVDTFGHSWKNQEVSALVNKGLLCPFFPPKETNEVPTSPTSPTSPDRSNKMKKNVQFVFLLDKGIKKKKKKKKLIFLIFYFYLFFIIFILIILILGLNQCKICNQRICSSCYLKIRTNQQEHGICLSFL
jgi:hypothetical protein